LVAVAVVVAEAMAQMAVLAVLAVTLLLAH
jgi:hypothetical protein